ncbi:sensor domain-containing diguanylate cyclase [Candidatus Stoquefichus massiliensis]|uniref:sensor domain-containing diguanylate cyclase n=1 Tax=Candidatus Stoquefichus massiliensis TaxID=1470350 RepID=UPI00047FC0AA|nr:GGDEF domain-containing protein [Candidatus Stoquefichus massiliensis]
MDYQETIFKLTDLLMNNEINSYIIKESLEIISNSFSFDCSAIYETDNIQFFYKKESYEKSKQLLPQQVTYETWQLPFMSHQKIYSIDIETVQNEQEIHLLNSFSLSNIIIVPFIDNECHAFIIFTGNYDALQLDRQAKQSLFIMTHLISQYIIMRMNQNKIKLVETTFESIIDSTGIDIYVNDFYTHDILYINKSMAAPYGGKEAFKNRKCWEVLFPGQTGPCDFCPQKYITNEHDEPASVYTWDYQRPFDGSWFRVFSAAFYWTDGRLAHVVSSADITDNKKQEAIIQYLANYDELTHLPNRRKLIKDAKDKINHLDESENLYTLFFDIDGFKKINDQYGHDTGDEFLIELSHFFRGIPLLKENVYRNGGDEFVAILYGKMTKINVQNLASFIHNRFIKPWVLKQCQVYCNISIGVACYREDGYSIDELLHVADMAMYQAKKSGNGCICYGSDLRKS